MQMDTKEINYCDYSLNPTCYEFMEQSVNHYQEEYIYRDDSSGNLDIDKEGTSESDK